MTQQKHEKPSSFPEKADTQSAQTPSVNQADGTAADRPRGETQAHAAQFNKGLADDTSSGGSKGKSTDKEVAKKSESKIDPSSPTKSTEGGTTSMPQNPTMDSAGEIGEPTGKGNIRMKDDTMNKDSKDKNNQQGNQANQQNKQGGQQTQGSNQASNQGDQSRQGGQQNMSGSSDRQTSGSQGQDYKQGQQSGSSQGSSSQGGNQSSQSGSDRSNQSGSQQGSQSGQNQSQQSGQKQGAGKEDSSDKDNKQGDRKTA